ncbi:unnamed protein product [Arctia plantaginis]|uniref:Uncharacterized protein n=1 Tax=Arctia plantaginis TaxID=874455 RepID=A0A8S1A9Z1_ARCPL|nr:unnamed protein product [Arctia plantaginis]
MMMIRYGYAICFRYCVCRNGDSEEDRYEDIRRSTLYGEIGSSENATGLQRDNKNLLLDDVKKTGQKLVLPDQTLDVNSLSNTDKHH